MKDTNLTKAPGKVGVDGKYIYGSSKGSTSQPSYDGKQEAGTSGISSGDGSSSFGPEVVIDPCVEPGEFAIFFQKPSDWDSSIHCYIWKDGVGEAVGGWPGTPMTNLGNGNYKLTLKEDLTGYNFIFNVGSDAKKTGDLKGLKMSAMYNTSGSVVKMVAEGECKVPEQVDIEEVLEQGVEVYSYGRVIYVENAEGKTITIRSLDGRILYSRMSMDEVSVAIPVNNAGIYLVTIEDATMKIMVQ